MVRTQCKRYILQVSLSMDEMNDLWRHLEQHYNTSVSEAWKLAGKDALKLHEIEALCRKAGITDVLSYAQALAAGSKQEVKHD